MSRRQVRLSHQAGEDLDHIADPLYAVVMKRLELLGDYPLLGAPLSDALTGWRSTVVRLFRIIYRIAPEGHVEIGYIRHCRRASPLN